MAERALAGVGLGYRRELAASLLTAPSSVGFVEIIAESCFAGGVMRREIEGLAEIWPVLPHGIKLSLGSADGIDEDHARRLGTLARALRAPLISEHVAFTRGRRREIGHLTQLPLSRTAVAVVARNLARTRRYLPDVPFLLENPAWTLRWSDDEMDEGSFFHEIVAATGCDLLLDIANLYANATNSGQDPLTLLRSYPLSRVAMVHMAGGAWREGFYVDTHCHPTPAAVLQLLAELVRIRGPVPVVLERDGRYPAWPEIAAELAAARDALGTAQAAEPPSVQSSLLVGDGGRPRIVSPPKADVAGAAALLAQQGQLAQLLTASPTDAASPPAAEAALPWRADEIARSRSVLRHKRVDEALEYLPRLRTQAGRQRIDLYALALAVLCAHGPAAQLPTIVDAMAIAAQLLAHPTLRRAARFDRLSLQARFALRSAGAQPRFAPYVHRAIFDDGSPTWVVKAPGRGSRVHFFIRKPVAARPEGSTAASTTRSP